MTYRQVLMFAVLMGAGSYIGTAAGKHASATSAIPYALASTVVIALLGCAAVAYRNGQPSKR